MYFQEKKRSIGS